MKFITVEQFLEQPKEIQDVFMDWWNYEWCDLYATTDEPWNPKMLDQDLESDIEGDWDYFKTLRLIPLLTEGQIRRFIVDKTGYKNIELIGNINTCEYDLNCYEEIYSASCDDIFPELGTDILQAYWKVACEIAKEEVENERVSNYY